MIARKIISTKKTLIILLTLVFASAIFSSSISIIYSLNNFNQYLYGNNEDVLVVYDREAQTPFTSRVPASFDGILNQIEGVEFTSPESMIPGILKDKPVLMRGVNFTSFSRLENIRITAGETFSNMDSASVMIGTSLANRLNVNLNEIIGFYGATKNNKILLEIVGIYQSSEEALNDEILAPFPVSEKVARRSNEFNHIKVKFDSSVTSSDTILDILSSRYNVEVSALQNNGTEQIDNWHLNVYDWEGDLINSIDVNSTTTVTLPFGEFLFEVKINDTVVRQETYFVQSDAQLNLNIENPIYTSTFITRVNDELKPAFIQIFDQSNSEVFSGYSNVDGEISVDLHEGAYDVILWSGLDKNVSSISITRMDTHVLSIDTNSTSGIIRQDVDSVVLTKSVGVLQFDNFNPDINYSMRIDGSSVAYHTTGVFYNLSTGRHALDIYDGNQLLRTIELVVDPQYSYFNPINMSNFSHIQPNQNIYFNSTGIKSDSKIEVLMNQRVVDFQLNDSILQVQIPSDTGTYNVSIQAVNYNGQLIKKSYLFFVEDTVNIAGLPISQTKPLLLSNMSTRFWYNQPLDTIFLNNTQVTFDTSYINIPDIPEGDYTLSFQSSTTFANYSVQVIDSLASEIFLSNSSLTQSLDAIPKWYADNLLLNSHPKDWNLSLYSNSYKYEINVNQTFPLQIFDEDVVGIEIWITGLDIKKIYQINYSRTQTEDLYPIFPDGMKSIYIDGIVNMGNDTLNPLSWTFDNLFSYTTDDKVYSYSNDQYQYLSPGYWNITVENENMAVSWNTTVPVWDNYSGLTNTVVSTIYGNVTVSSQVSFGQNILHYNGGSYYFSLHSDTLYTGQTVANTNDLTLSFDPSLYGMNWTISTTVEDVVMGNYTSLFVDSIDSGEYRLHYSAIHRNNSIISGFVEIIVYDTKISSVIQLYDSKYSINHLEITNIRSQEQIVLSENINNTNFELLPGIWDISYSTFYYQSHLSISNTSEININTNPADFELIKYNSNFNTSEIHTGLVEMTVLQTGMKFSYRSSLDNVEFTPGNYKIKFEWADSLVSQQINISQNTTSVVTLPIKYDSGLIVINNDYVINQNTVLLTHQNLGVSQLLERSSNGWFVSDFPIGEIILSVDFGRDNLEFSGLFQPDIDQLVFSVDTSDIVNEEKFLSYASTIDGDLATQFFNEEFTGPFAFLRIALAAETIVIIFLLFVNISGVYAGLITESKHEIRTVKSLGFSTPQIILSILYDTFKFSILVTLLGNVIGILIGNILVNANQTVLFGHRFIPQFPFSFWIINLIVVHFIMIISTWFGLKLEEDTIRKI